MAHWTIPDIVKVCGGSIDVAIACGLTPSAVQKWRYNGIVWEHWARLVEMSGGVLSIVDIYAANLATIPSRAARSARWQNTKARRVPMTSPGPT